MLSATARPCSPLQNHRVRDSASFWPFVSYTIVLLSSSARAWSCDMSPARSQNTCVGFRSPVRLTQCVLADYGIYCYVMSQQRASAAEIDPHISRRQCWVSYPNCQQQAVIGVAITNIRGISAISCYDLPCRSSSLRDNCTVAVLSVVIRYQVVHTFIILS